MFRSSLRTPYPFFYDFRTALIINVILFGITFLFLFLFRPFEINEKELILNYPETALVHSLVSFILFFGLTLLLPLVRTAPYHWTLLHELIFIFTVLICIGIGQFLIRDFIYDNPNNWSWRYLLTEVKNTVLIGGLFALVLTTALLEKLKVSHVVKSSCIHIPELNTHEISNQVVTIQTQVQSDNFTLKIADFLYAKADKNYLEIQLPEQKLLKRISLKSFKEQLIQFPEMQQTHRSYLVNLKAISSITGNAQGYQLSLKNSTTTVPVSRNQIESFEKKLQALNA
jgi:hypothetical protein